MAGFGDSVNLNCQKILERIDKKCYSIAWNLFTTIVHATPVLKGELINNWFPLAGNSFSSEITSSLSLSGSGSLTRINALVNSKQFYGKDGVMTMTNNLSYAANAEYLGWPAPQWSGKVGPYRMVGMSLAKIAAENR